MDWIKITDQSSLPTSGNFLVCENFDAIANVYWDQAPLSDEFELYIETMGGPKIWYEYTPTHFIKL